MKKVLLITMLSAAALLSNAQSEKYMKAMQEKISVMDTTRSPEILQGLSAAFERIGDAEKTQWLPYYYAALTQINLGYFLTGGQLNGGLADKIDPIADKADNLLNKAEELSKENSEIFIVKKMSASLRMMADPMNRYMQYGPIAQEALETARKLNPANPRIYLLEGQDKFFTPEQFGGSKTEAKKLFEEALLKFESFKPGSSIDPNWGRATATYFLNQVK